MKSTLNAPPAAARSVVVRSSAPSTPPSHATPQQWATGTDVWVDDMAPLCATHDLAALARTNQHLASIFVLPLRQKLRGMLEGQLKTYGATLRGLGAIRLPPAPAGVSSSTWRGELARAQALVDRHVFRTRFEDGPRGARQQQLPCTVRSLDPQQLVSDVARSIVALTDVHMGGGLVGYRALRAFAEGPALPALRSLAVTSHHTEPDDVVDVVAGIVKRAPHAERLVLRMLSPEQLSAIVDALGDDVLPDLRALEANHLPAPTLARFAAKAPALRALKVLELPQTLASLPHDVTLPNLHRIEQEWWGSTALDDATCARLHAVAPHLRDVTIKLGALDTTAVPALPWERFEIIGAARTADVVGLWQALPQLVHFGTGSCAAYADDASPAALAAALRALPATPMKIETVDGLPAHANGDVLVELLRRAPALQTLKAAFVEPGSLARALDALPARVTFPALRELRPKPKTFEKLRMPFSEEDIAALRKRAPNLERVVVPHGRHNFMGESFAYVDALAGTDAPRGP